jgi:hypothetical protein
MLVIILIFGLVGCFFGACYALCKTSKNVDIEDSKIWKPAKGYQPKNSTLPELKPGQRLVPDAETAAAVRQILNNNQNTIKR